MTSTTTGMEQQNVDEKFSLSIYWINTTVAQ